MQNLFKKLRANSGFNVETEVEKEEEGFHVAGDVLPSTKDAETLGQRIFVSKEAAALALKNGLKQQRGEYISRLKQIRVAFEKQRMDTSEETLQLQQTLKMLREEFQKSEETLIVTKKERDDATTQVSRLKQESESLREIMASMGTELKVMRNRIQELQREDNMSDDGDFSSTKILVSRPPARSVDVACKSTTIHVSRHGSVGILDNNNSNIEKENLLQARLPDLREDSNDKEEKVDQEDQEDKDNSNKKEEKDKLPRHTSLIGSALLGLGSLWGSSNNISTTEPPTTPTRRSRRRSVSDPQSSPRSSASLKEPPMTPEKSGMKQKIEMLERQINQMREEQSDLDINHRCEVKSLKDIVKAMSSELDNLNSEKKLLTEEKNRLLEAMAKTSAE